MFKIFKSLMLIIWIIDILNINFMVNGVSVQEFLDITVPLNTLFWIIFWLLVPGSETLRVRIKED